LILEPVIKIGKDQMTIECLEMLVFILMHITFNQQKFE